MNKKEILQELKEKFQETKKDLGFRPSFEELDGAFFIRDGVLSAGFVSERFSRQLCSRIVETCSVWNNYLHSLLMPNPGHILNMNESKMFSEEERKEIMDLISSSMAITSRNNVIGLKKNKKEEADFINEAFNFWNEKFRPATIKITEKINKGWEKQ
jgi:hypothetical protein